MTNRRTLFGAMALGLMIATQFIAAQSNPRLGVWKLNLTKSTYQHGPAPKSETRTYTVWQGDGNSVRVETMTATGQQLTTFNSKLDGKEYPYNSPTADKIVTKGSDWSAVDSVVSKAGKAVQTTHSVVSKDGKMLTMTSHYPGDTKTDVRVYDKQ